MTRLLSGLSLLLFHCFAYAQSAVADDPEPTGQTAVIVFVLIFVGMCVGFFWMVYAADKKKGKQANTKKPDAPGKTS